MKFQIYLPVFSGFYNTIWQPSLEDYESENNYEFERDYRFDNRGYEDDVAKRLCALFAKEFPKFIKSIEFEEVWSPKEYNFKNDSINCTMQLKINALRDYVRAHPIAFDEYLKQHFTSCDGFISFYSNDAEVWYQKMRVFKNLSATEMVSILEFACVHIYTEEHGGDKSDLELSLYYEIELYPEQYCTPIEKETA